ncbi:MAG: hypothetical protein ABIW31_02550 [Novosphingobium sp.]
MTKLIVLSLIALSGPVLAVPGGLLDILPRGNFICELPGDASGPVGLHDANADFTVINDSSYRTAQGDGIYLLTGEKVIMTSGPMNGTQFRRVTDRFLRKLDASGSETKLRCVFRVANNER